MPMGVSHYPLGLEASRRITECYDLFIEVGDAKNQLSAAVITPNG